MKPFKNYSDTFNFSLECKLVQLNVCFMFNKSAFIILVSSQCRKMFLFQFSIVFPANEITVRRIYLSQILFVSFKTRIKFVLIVFFLFTCIYYMSDIDLLQYFELNIN